MEFLKQCRKFPIKDNVQVSWLKKLAKMHVRVSRQLNNMLELEDQVPTWMAY